MHPVFCKWYAIGCLTLGDLIFMMRKDQILSAGMNVNLVSKVFFGHNRTLDMPARTAFAPVRIPIWLAIFFRFPEYEIQRILFQIAGYFDISVSGFQIIDVFMGKLAVLSKFSRSVIYGTICCLISITFIDQRLDHCQHARNLLRSQRMSSCRFYIHICHIFFALSDVAFCHFFCGSTLFNGFFYDFVIYICKIGYIIDFVSFVFQISAHRIEYDHRTGISNMDKIVYGRSAYIHFYFSFLKRHELFFLLGQRIVKFHVFISYLYISGLATVLFISSSLPASVPADDRNTQIRYPHSEAS